MGRLLQGFRPEISQMTTRAYNAVREHRAKIDLLRPKASQCQGLAAVRDSEVHQLRLPFSKEMSRHCIPRKLFTSVAAENHLREKCGKAAHLEQ